MSMYAVTDKSDKNAYTTNSQAQRILYILQQAYICRQRCIRELSIGVLLNNVCICAGFRAGLFLVCDENTSIAMSYRINGLNNECTAF